METKKTKLFTEDVVDTSLEDKEDTGKTGFNPLKQ